MKIVFAIAICLTLVACNESENVKSFPSGKYVAAWENEFGKTYDTMVIEPKLSKQNNVFQITRYSSAIFFDSSRKKICKTSNWTGNYNRKSGSLLIQENGRILFFDVAKNEMKSGIEIYKKQ